MTKKDSISRLLLLLVVSSGLLIIFGIASEFFGNNAIEALSATFSILLSGLLVRLYSQQKDVLERQERIMEANYIPNLSYEGCKFVPTEMQMTFGGSDDLAHESAEFKAYNYGKDRADNIRAEIIIGTNISLSMNKEKQLRQIRGMAKQADVSRFATRKDSGLKKPFNSLESEESTTFLSKSYIRYLPTGETYMRFQDLNLEGVNPGENIACILVVEYQDILGNKYRDIPFCQVVEYVPNTPLNKFPTADESVPNPSSAVYQNIEHRGDGNNNLN